jgi:hypothetical protein
MKALLIAAMCLLLMLCAHALPPAIPDALRFVERAADAGIHARLRCGGDEKRWIPEANGSGLAWLDYDNDGLLDLLIVNGADMDTLRATMAGKTPTARAGSVYLYRNLGNGHFEDVTQKAGLSNAYWGTGANAADYNNDGFPDILITSIGRDVLFKNNGDGTFNDVTHAAGLSQEVNWHTGSAFGDFDGDGYLDLYVSAYIDIRSMSFREPAPVCDFMGIHGFCGPIGMKPGSGILYRNNHDGTFTDVTKQAGLSTGKTAHSFTAVFDDFNHDGKIDLFVANDSDPNFLFLNQGDGTFKEAALERGVAFNGDGRAQSNMGVAVGDYDNQGKLALFTTTFFEDYFPLFHQNQRGDFEDVSTNTGLTELTRPLLGWACGFTDFGNTGKRDLWTANGHVYPLSPAYQQRISIFRNTNRNGAAGFVKGYEFPDIPKSSYRGGAAGDFNNDGRMDLAVLPIAGAPVLLENQTDNKNSWVGFTLRGKRSNRDAIGASITLQACGASQFDTVRNGGSYVSRNDPRVHFGLGTCSKVDRVTITWPRGTVQTLDSPALNRYAVVDEPN